MTQLFVKSINHLQYPSFAGSTSLRTSISAVSGEAHVLAIHPAQNDTTLPEELSEQPGIPQIMSVNCSRCIQYGHHLRVGKCTTAHARRIPHPQRCTTHRHSTHHSEGDLDYYTLCLTVQLTLHLKLVKEHKIVHQRRRTNRIPTATLHATHKRDQ